MLSILDIVLFYYLDFLDFYNYSIMLIILAIINVLIVTVGLNLSNGMNLWGKIGLVVAMFQGICVMEWYRHGLSRFYDLFRILLSNQLIFI